MTKLIPVGGLVVALGVAPLAARPAEPHSAKVPSASVVTDSSVAGTIAVLDSLIRVAPPPPPPGLTPAQRQEWSRHTTWLRGVRTQLLPFLRPSDPAKAANLLLVLQAKLLADARPITPSFPALKTRHDAAMNAIRNMRA